MNTMRLAIATLIFALVANSFAPATAQEDGKQPSEASVRQADPSKHRANRSDEPEENDTRKVPDDRLGRAFNVTFSASNPAALAPGQDQCAAPSNTNSLDDGFDGCFRPFCADPCPCAYGRVEALFMQRVPQIGQQPIVVDPNTNTTFLSTSDLKFDFNPGLHATLGMRLCGGRAVELDYFGLFGGNSSAAAVAPNPAAFLIFPNNLVGNVFVDMDTTVVTYSSTLHSFAANFLCCCGCCDECCDECGCSEFSCRSVSWFAGFRYLSLAERLNISAQRAVAGGVENGDYNISTNNNLYGGQLGATVRRTQGRFGWDATGFAGIFGNDAQQTQSVTDFPNFALRPTVTSRNGGVAFVGGVNLSALYALTEVWNVRAGYNVLWIEGLALAPNQLDFNFAAAQGGSQLHNGGGMFLHGANIGLEARW